MRTSHFKLDFLVAWPPLLAALLLAGCSGDGNVLLMESSGGGGADSGRDARLDSTSTDRISTAEGESGGIARVDSSTDSSTESEASDSGAIDSSADSGGVDVIGEVIVADGGVDSPQEGEAAAPLTVDQFQGAVAVAFCDRLAECCQLSAQQFDRDRCIGNISTGFGPDRIFTYLRLYTASGDSGRLPASLFFDPTQAAQCVNLQRNRGCMSEDGAEKRNLYATCLGAVQGTTLVGSPCTTSQECRSNLYCRISEAGTGTCTVLATSGQQCDDPNRSSDQCTYLGIHSSTSLHCSAFASTGGTCVAGLDIGTTCRADQQCASGVCSLLNATCVTSQPNYPGPVTCNLFIRSDDAGGQ